MKKIATALTVLLSGIALASCSNSSSSKLDNDSLKSNIATEWMSNEAIKYDVTNNYLNTIEGEGSHFKLSMPSEGINESIRAHRINISNKQIGQGSINVIYASTSSQSTLSSYKDDIEDTIAAKKLEIMKNISLFAVDVQTTWSQEITMEKSDSNQCLVVYYLPLRFNYYSGKDESTTLKLATYIFLPIKVEVSDYTEENGETKFNNDLVNLHLDLLIDWETNKNGSIK